MLNLSKSLFYDQIPAQLVVFRLAAVALMLHSIVLGTWTKTTSDMEKCNETLIQVGIPSQETNFININTEDITAVWWGIQ